MGGEILTPPCGLGGGQRDLCRQGYTPRHWGPWPTNAPTAGHAPGLRRYIEICDPQTARRSLWQRRRGGGHGLRQRDLPLIPLRHGDLSCWTRAPAPAAAPPRASRDPGPGRRGDQGERNVPSIPARWTRPWPVLPTGGTGLPGGDPEGVQSHDPGVQLQPGVAERGPEGGPGAASSGTTKLRGEVRFVADLPSRAKRIDDRRKW